MQQSRSTVHNYIVLDTSPEESSPLKLEVSRYLASIGASYTSLNIPQQNGHVDSSIRETLEKEIKQELIQHSTKQNLPHVIAITSSSSILLALDELAKKKILHWSVLLNDLPQLNTTAIRNSDETELRNSLRVLLQNKKNLLACSESLATEIFFRYDFLPKSLAYPVIEFNTKNLKEERTNSQVTIGIINKHSEPGLLDSFLSSLESINWNLQGKPVAVVMTGDYLTQSLPFRPGRSSCISVLGQISITKIQKALQACDIIYVTSAKDNAQSEKYCLNQTFSLAAGLKIPIFYHGRLDSLATATLDKHKFGRSCGKNANSQEIKDTLEHLLAISPQSEPSTSLWEETHQQFAYNDRLLGDLLATSNT